MADATQFKSPTSIRMAPGGTYGTVNFGEDENLLVCFYNHATPDTSRSTEEGRPIYRDVIHVRIQQPGEMLNIIDRPANDSDKRRFKTQWANFVHDRTQIPEGTPIEMLFPNHPAVAENLRGFGVYTIEQCAALSATAIDTVGRGGQEYVTRAQKYIQQATSGKAFHVLQKQVDDKNQQIRVMEQQMEMMKHQLDALTLKFNDPIRGAEQPPFIHGYDVQSERINANASSKQSLDVKKKSPRRTPTVEDKITDPFSGDTQTEAAE